MMMQIQGPTPFYNDHSETNVTVKKVLRSWNRTHNLVMTQPYNTTLVHKWFKIKFWVIFYLISLATTTLGQSALRTVGLS